MNDKKIIATIEARMTSARLPGKVMMLAGNIPMLSHLINRLKAVPSIDEIILATTSNKTDDLLEQLAFDEKISCFRGSENDVMGRVLDAAKYFHGDIIVETTGDCPIIDPNLIEQGINTFMINNVDYLSNCHIRSYPDGMDYEIFTLTSLAKSALLTNDSSDREHVSLHIRNNPKIFKHLYLYAPTNLYDPSLGLTLDEMEDYILIKNIIENFGESNNLFSLSDVLNYLEDNPELRSLNIKINRKGYSLDE